MSCAPDSSADIMFGSAYLKTHCRTFSRQAIYYGYGIMDTNIQENSNIIYIYIHIYRIDVLHCVCEFLSNIPLKKPFLHASLRQQAQDLSTAGLVSLHFSDPFEQIELLHSELIPPKEDLVHAFAIDYICVNSMCGHILRLKLLHYALHVMDNILILENDSEWDLCMQKMKWSIML